MNRIETFDRYRPLLFSIAYRMLGVAMDAEDMVQETFLRWQSSPEAIESPKAYLSAVVTRLCIDQLRSARVQREEYIGPWLPEPIATETPHDSAVLADSLSIAFLRVLESLSPVERAAFLLREVFDYGYDEIAHIVGKSEANCRQMVKRAKARIAGRRPRFAVRREEHGRLLAEFSQACLTGDVNGLLSLFADDITLYSDGGGKRGTARKPIYTPAKVVRFLFAILRKAPPGFSARIAQVNGQPAIISYTNSAPYSVLTIDVADGRIRSIYNIINPDKLAHMPSKS